MRWQSIVLTAAIVIGPTGHSKANLYEWSASSGGNGHFYEPVLVPAGIDWEGANAAAIARGGYLATITSSAENTFVYNLIGSDPAFWRWTGPYNAEGPFLGGYKYPETSSPAANWHWVTGEPWTYSNWVPIEPSGPELQNRLHFFGYYARSGNLWNDVWATNYPESGYVVEFTTNPVPLPGSILLGVWGVGFAAWRTQARRRRNLPRSLSPIVPDWRSRPHAQGPPILWGRLPALPSIRPSGRPGDLVPCRACQGLSCIWSGSGVLWSHASRSRAVSCQSTNLLAPTLVVSPPTVPR